VGVAWGPACERCPAPGTRDYSLICPGGQGFRPSDKSLILEDVNECQELKNICANGRCTNTFGSYICNCNQGFKLDDKKVSKCVHTCFMSHYKVSDIVTTKLFSMYCI
jgi:hypothetical protein